MPRGSISKRSAKPVPAGLPPTGPAGGELAGTFPNPTVVASTTETANSIARRTALAELFATAFRTVGAGQVTAATTLVIQSGAGNIMVIDSGSTLYFEITGLIKASLDAAGQLHVGNDADVAGTNLRVNGLVNAAAVLGAAGALPALPAGYLQVNINGAVKNIPFYN